MGSSADSIVQQMMIIINEESEMKVLLQHTNQIIAPTGIMNGNGALATSAGSGSPPSPPPAAAAAAVRPYTSYNLFFQLEREYILQAVHGYRPKILPHDRFDPLDRSNYSGPPLPPRYADLLLPYDWHIPGKTRRRKRSHRKSHGKIGFHELNDQISKAWGAADDETREFCNALSDMEGRKYKQIRKESKKNERNRANSKDKAGNKKRGAAIAKALTDGAPRFDRSTPLPRDDSSPASGLAGLTTSSPGGGGGGGARPCARPAPSRIGRTVSRESFSSDNNDRGGGGGIFRAGSRGSSAAAATPSLRDSINSASTLAEVDMEDDEIMELWDSIPLEDGRFAGDGPADGPAGAAGASSSGAPSNMCQVCVELPSPSDNPPNSGPTPSTLPEGASVAVLPSRPREEAPTARDERPGDGAVAADATRRSFIDEEYERFREIGKVYRTERRMLKRSPSSGGDDGGIVRGGGGSRGIPSSALMMKPFVARGA